VLTTGAARAAGTGACRTGFAPLRAAPETSWGGEERRSAGPAQPWLSLPAQPTSVAEGRRLVARIDGMPPPVLEAAQIVVSELLTNALEHSGVAPSQTIALRLSRHGDRLRIDVDDGGGAFSGSSEDPPRSYGRHRGRGLRIVGRLALHWQASDGRVSAWIEI
jgi:anti-sigma regulatory factor (Ser/Thr protein kinase)